MNPTLNYGNIQAVRVQDLMVKEIIESNNWERPIYFAVTCSEDSKIGLSDYLRMEGMAYRLVPEKRQSNEEFIEPEILNKNLTGAVGYSRNYQPGFKFRGLNDPNIFFDDNQQRMVINYRTAFLKLSIYYLTNGNKDLAASVLDEMEAKIPLRLFPMEYFRVAGIADLYNRAGDKEKYLKLSAEVEKEALIDFENNIGNAQNLMTPFQVLNEIYETQGRNDKLLELWLKIETVYPQDPNVKANVQKYRSLVQEIDTSKIIQ
jgi:tetratricopeptide (TPR) repeat protein